jgi:hypothetical protein
VAKIAEVRIKSAQWHAERRDARYRAKQEISGSGGVTVVIARGGMDTAPALDADIIDAEIIPITDSDMPDADSAPAFAA